MKKLLKKDARFRLYYKLNQHYKLVLKTIYKNQYIENSIKWKSLYLITLIKKQASISMLNNCCIYSGRSSSINKKFKFSRLMILKLVKSNSIYGLKKLYW